ncbi:hypothetical protein, partial [Spirillospora sp. NPDC048819]|uniref:hypothetical protein n=1 Tax=Spirillospora sp. NPDC048819 TaxID=3155268 RepID=UPI003402A91F
MAHRSPRHRLSAEAAQRELRPAAAGDETDAHLRQKDLLGALAAARTAHPSHLREIAKRSPGEPHR